MKSWKESWSWHWLPSSLNRLWTRTKHPLEPSFVTYLKNNLSQIIRQFSGKFKAVLRCCFSLFDVSFLFFFGIFFHAQEHFENVQLTLSTTSLSLLWPQRNEAHTHTHRYTTANWYLSWYPLDIHPQILSLRCRACRLNERLNAKLMPA